MSTTVPSAPKYSQPNVVKSTSTANSTPPEGASQHGSYDVLCERNRKAFKHVGNRRFRVICENHVKKYTKLNRKVDKSQILTDIIDIIHAAGGRFLAKNKKNSDYSWEQLTQTQTREKVGIALRTAVAARKAQVNTRTIYNIIYGQDHAFKQAKRKLEKQVTAKKVSIYVSTDMPTLTDAMASHIAASTSTFVSTPLSERTTSLIDDIFSMPSMDEVDDVMDDFFSSTSLLDMDFLLGPVEEIDTQPHREDEEQEPSKPDEGANNASLLLQDLEEQLGDISTDDFASPLIPEVVDAIKGNVYHTSSHFLVRQE